MADGGDVMSFHNPRANVTLVCLRKKIIKVKETLPKKRVYPEARSIEITKCLIGTKADTVIAVIELKI